MIDLTKLQFYSGNNYLKRSEFWDQTNAVFTGSGFNQVEVAHNLGYIPQFMIATNYGNDGVWWANEYCGAVRGTGGNTTGVVMVNPSIDTNNLYIIAGPDAGGSLGATNVPVKYGIYLDQ